MLSCRLFTVLLSTLAVTSVAARSVAQPIESQSARGPALAPSLSVESTESGEEDQGRALLGGGVGDMTHENLAEGRADGSDAIPGVDSELIGLSALFVGMVTFFFTISMAILGFLSFSNYRGAKQWLDTKFSELDGTRQRLSGLDHELDVKTKELREALAHHESVSFDHRRFFEAVRGELFQLLVGIVENVGDTLGSRQERELKSLITEAESCLGLFSPDADEVTHALWRLEQVGSSNSVSPLNTLVQDQTVDPETRLRALRALQVVITRLDRGGGDPALETDAGSEPGEPPGELD